CRHKISIQYPIVEFFTGLIFGVLGALFFKDGVYFSYDSLLIFCYLVIAALLIAITAYDMHHMIIPDEWSYLFSALALSSSLYVWGGQGGALWVILSGPIVAAPLYALWAVSGGRWMGLGDPKLALGIGWLLGIYSGLIAVFLSFIIGAIISV